MKFDESLVQPIIPRAINKETSFVLKKSKTEPPHKFKINLKDCKPVLGGFEVSIEGKKYNLSYTELNIKNRRLLLNKGPRLLIIPNIKNSQSAILHTYIRRDARDI